MQQSIVKIDTAKQHLSELGARDYHDLSRYHQAQSMALIAELSLKAALLREESRGNHKREDFPERDDQKWLKWIVIKDDGGKAAVSTESLPFEKYRIKM
jgi:succinate dehydrogenase/fumarate reductase flavoprotein subunit